MKKSLIFITVISLLITLFIPNIALAQEPCTLTLERGYAGEETTITGKVAGWKEVPGAIGVWFGLSIYNIETGVSTHKFFYTEDTNKDPFSGSLSVNLEAGNYEAGIYSTTYDGEYETPYCDYFTEFIVVERPAPAPEPCYCSLLVQIRDEAGHPINGAKFKVDNVEKKTVNGDARWDNLECGKVYEVIELSPIKYKERIKLENECGKRSTLRIVNKIEEEVVEEIVEEVIIPEAGLDFNFTALYAIAGLGILRILLGIERKRK